MAEDYLARRQELGTEASRLLVAAAGIDTFLIDTGIDDERLCSPAELAAMTGGKAYEVVRLEALAEHLLNEGTGALDFAPAVERALHDSTAVAAKSIAAYRVGLDLPPALPSRDDLVTAVASLRPSASGRYRIADPVINAWLAWTAIKIGMPLQVHVGYGDADIDLLHADPLRLTPFLRATEERGVPVLLLHNYPFHRQCRVPGAGVQPRLHRCRTGRTQHRRAQPDTDPRNPRAGPVRQAAVLHRRVRAGRALPPRRRSVPTRTIGRSRRVDQGR